MSRPDAVYWRNTNDLNSLEFSPGRLVYNRIPRWISALLVLQIVLGAAIFCAARVTPVMALVREFTGATGSAASPAAPGAAPTAAPGIAAPNVTIGKSVSAAKAPAAPAAPVAAPPR